MKKAREPLPLVAAQNRRSELTERWVAEIQRASTLFDGNISSTKWDVTHFGGTITGNGTPPPGWTIGDEFTAQVNSTLWENMPGRLGMGTMIHEIIHKFGLDDKQTETALDPTLVGPNSTVLTKRLRDSCVP